MTIKISLVVYYPVYSPLLLLKIRKWFIGHLQQIPNNNQGALPQSGSPGWLPRAPQHALVVSVAMHGPRRSPEHSWPPKRPHDRPADFDHWIFFWKGGGRVSLKFLAKPGFHGNFCSKSKGFSNTSSTLPSFFQVQYCLDEPCSDSEIPFPTDPRIRICSKNSAPSTSLKQMPRYVHIDSPPIKPLLCQHETSHPRTSEGADDMAADFCWCEKVV